MTWFLDLDTADDGCGEMLRWCLVDGRWHLADNFEHVPDPGDCVTTDAIPAHATFCPFCRADADYRLRECAA